MYVLPEQPMTVFQVIKHACAFWVKTVNKVLPLTLIYGLLIAVVNYYNAKPLEQFPHPALKFLLPLIGSLLGLIILVAVFVRMNSELTGKQILMGDAIKIGIQRTICVIYWYIIITLIIIPPLILLFIIGYFLHPPINYFAYSLIPLYLVVGSVYLYVSFPLIAAEDFTATTAIKQSYRLVNRQWWHTFCIMILSISIMSIPGIVLYQQHQQNNPLAIFIFITLITSFACGISLIQLHHLRAYHKLKDSKI